MRQDKRSVQSLTDQKSKLFFSGVFILTASNLLVKLIGLFFKIPMSYILHDEGMGYFNSAYTIYTWLYMVSTAGLPVAVSILVARARAQGRVKLAAATGKIALGVFFLIGLLGSLLMLAFARSLAGVIGSGESVYAIVAIAPTLFFICIASALRGYYQGCQLMGPTALSQVIEAAGKLLPGILLAILAAKRGYALPVIAGFAILGVTVGAAFGMLFLLLIGVYYKKKDRFSILEPISAEPPERFGTIIRHLLVIALPITLSASVMSLTNLIDLAVIMRRLQSIGLTEPESAALYGNYTTLVVPMFNLPAVLIYPIAYAMVPMLSAALASGNRKLASELMNFSLRCTSLIALPCAMGMGVMSRPILSMLYAEPSAKAAAPLLSIISPAIFFVCLLAITNSVLQATGHAKKPIISMTAGAVVKLASSLILIGNPRIGIYGAPLGTLFCYVTVMIFNLYFIVRHTGTVPSLTKVFLAPLGASACSISVSVLLLRFLQRLIGQTPAALLAIAFSVGLYVVAVFRFGALTKEDLSRLPQGEKIGLFLRKLKIMKSSK
ncbi:MAG: polysaccharide biosynthesis protein [Eubacteriales bacterium]